MNIGPNFRIAAALSAPLFAASFPAMAEAGAGANVIVSRTAEVDSPWPSIWFQYAVPRIQGLKYVWGHL
jgi:hypothetical protein